MLPDHQITSKMEGRRAKGKPTQTHAGFAKWGWRLGINVLVPGAGRGLVLHQTALTFGVTEPSLFNGLHAGPATRITRPRDSVWHQTVERPDAQAPAVPVRLRTGLEARLMYGGLLSPFWVGSPQLLLPEVEGDE